jgi:hypothetical protein
LKVAPTRTSRSRNASSSPPHPKNALGIPPASQNNGQGTARAPPKNVGYEYLVHELAK